MKKLIVLLLLASMALAGNIGWYNPNPSTWTLIQNINSIGPWAVYYTRVSSGLPGFITGQSYSITEIHMTIGPVDHAGAIGGSVTVTDGSNPTHYYFNNPPIPYVSSTTNQNLSRTFPSPILVSPTATLNIYFSSVGAPSVTPLRMDNDGSHDAYEYNYMWYVTAGDWVIGLTADNTTGVQPASLGRVKASFK